MHRTRTRLALSMSSLGASYSFLAVRHGNGNPSTCSSVVLGCRPPLSVIQTLITLDRSLYSYCFSGKPSRSGGLVRDVYQQGSVRRYGSSEQISCCACGLVIDDTNDWHSCIMYYSITLGRYFYTSITRITTND